MPDIAVLPRHLVNKIAAGEVVERPASVVKELVENALDAGARTVEITIEDGGRRLIAVRDDGGGMGPDDLALAFAAHATSKITSEDDLFKIHTLGFRGEALASIASVSHAQIITRRPGSLEGWEIKAEGETLGEARPAAAPPGTTVTVRDLFFNTPGRRKFMKAAETEFGHIVEQLARLALPCCDVAFRLTHTGRVTHELPAGDMRRRVADLFGMELAEGLIEFDSPEGSSRVWGMLGPPSAARASGRWQYFFVNGRFVRDRSLMHALREAYHGLVEPSRWPVAFVFLQVPPDEIDVNVHPTKIEVRFRQQQLVHSQVKAAIREGLNRAELSSPMAVGPAALDERLTDDQRRQSLKQAMADFFKTAPRPVSAPPTTGAAGEYDPFADLRGETAISPAPGRPDPLPGVLGDDEADASLPAGPPMAAAPTSAPIMGEVSQGSPPDMQPSPILRQIPSDLPGRPWRAMQVHNSYIVAATETGLVIIDQHALHERILYEEVSARLAAGRLASQGLLIPLTLQLGRPDLERLLRHGELLDRLGIEVTEFGPDAAAVHRVPALLVERKSDPAEFLRDLIDLLAEHDSAEPHALLDKLVATIACKAAIKAGEPLTDEEIQALLNRRRGLGRGSSCPHGRPTTLALSLEDLHRQFKRT